MPEYLAPGVYVEEVSFRHKSIEGVSTSVAGFIGPTRYGPVGGVPELITSFSAFTRIYGGIDYLAFGGEEQINFMAHAVRAFFDNGGARLYCTRVFEPTPPAGGGQADENAGKALFHLSSPPGLTLRARFPGQAGKMTVTFALRAANNSFVHNQLTGEKFLRGVRAGDVVIVIGPTDTGPSALVPEDLYDVVDDNGTLTLQGLASGAGNPINYHQLDGDLHRVHKISVTVATLGPGRFDDEMVWEDLSPAPDSRGSLTSLFTATPASRQEFLHIPFQIDMANALSGAQVLQALVTDGVIDSLRRSLLSRQELSDIGASPPGIADLEKSYLLEDGSDGVLPPATAFEGEDDDLIKTGLKTFEDVEEISIVAAPGATADYTNNQARADGIVQALVSHCQIRMKYRVAVVESPDHQALSEVQAFRGKFDSTHAALYYPWLTVVDPIDPSGRKEIQISPAGFVSGIYARSDITHGVFKAPANEVAVGAIDFERILNKAEQDVLNPRGINCFRFFEGRGFRLWGARTISSDPEWRYISVRRYFAYLEHSIDRGTQWAVFENNSEPLWANIRRTIEDFLVNEWRNGALMGSKPEEAFFVRCDRSTMTQADIDNGRLVCLIGVAVVKPAEYVIFRIGQMTAESRR